MATTGLLIAAAGIPMVVLLLPLMLRLTGL